MGLSIGITGLPNAGKSALFNALCRHNSPTAPYPFTTIDPFTGETPLPDVRLEALKELLNPEITTPATVRFVDIAGLVKGASKGEGLGNRFLSHIRGVDAQCQVVRFFEKSDIPHPYGDIDPVRDAEIVSVEIILSDLEIVERRLAGEEKGMKVGEKGAVERVDALSVLREHLMGGGLKEITVLFQGSSFPIPPSELPLISLKPLIYVANLGEEQWEEREALVRPFREWAERGGNRVVPLPVLLEEEIMEMEEGERPELRREFGLGEGGLELLVREGFNLLSLITFYTTVGRELKAWNVKEGTTALEAAGKIHTDMMKGFIRAEVVPFEEFIRHGGEKGARETGAIHTEGRDYRVRDGDIIHFRFRG